MLRSRRRACITNPAMSIAGSEGILFEAQVLDPEAVVAYGVPPSESARPERSERAEGPDDPFRCDEDIF